MVSIILFLYFIDSKNKLNLKESQHLKLLYVRKLENIYLWKFFNEILEHDWFQFLRF